MKRLAELTLSKIRHPAALGQKKKRVKGLEEDRRRLMDRTLPDMLDITFKRVVTASSLTKTA